MKILITGGLGYLGCELTKLLLELDEVTELTIIDKAVYGIAPLSSLISSKLKLLVRDLRDVDSVSAVINEADVIIHLASLVGAPLVDRKPKEAWDSNILATKVIADHAKPDARIFFASTGSCYGKIEGVCNEESPISPLSSYGVHKAEGEKILAGLNTINMRFATVYGLSFRTRNDLFINNMIKKALNDRSLVLYEGHAMRTFIHVSDAARAVRFLVMENNLQHRTYNIGDEGLALSKREICAKVGELTPFTVIEDQFNADIDQRDYQVSYDRLYNEGFRPTANFEHELTNLFTYYQGLNDAKYENG